MRRNRLVRGRVLAGCGSAARGGSSRILHASAVVTCVRPRALDRSRPSWCGCSVRIVKRAADPPVVKPHRGRTSMGQKVRTSNRRSGSTLGANGLRGLETPSNVRGRRADSVKLGLALVMAEMNEPLLVAGVHCVEVAPRSAGLERGAVICPATCGRGCCASVLATAHFDAGAVEGHLQSLPGMSGLKAARGPRG
jgi:hypothetical protein